MRDLTLVTHCTADAYRLDHLAFSARTFQGPLSVALFVWPQDWNSSLEDRLHQLLRTGSVQIDVVEADAHQPRSTYPINALRNLAIRKARTDLVLPIPVDAAPSEGLAEHLRTLPDSLVEPGNLLCIPGLEKSGDLSTESVLRMSKAELRSMMHAGRIAPVGTADDFHGLLCLDYDRWLESTEPYVMSYSLGFEPYYVADRRWLPAYDERYVGYGKNAMEHAYRLFRRRVRFHVSPFGFFIDQKHPWTVMKRGYRTGHSVKEEDPLADEIKERNIRMWRRLVAGEIPPVDREQT